MTANLKQILSLYVIVCVAHFQTHMCCDVVLGVCIAFGLFNRLLSIVRPSIVLACANSDDNFSLYILIR